MVTLYWPKQLSEDPGALRSCWGKTDSFTTVVKAAQQPHKDHFAPQQGFIPYQHALPSGDFLLFFSYQLDISLWLAKPTLLRTNLIGKIHFNWIWTLFLLSPLAWNNSVTNLSFTVGYFFIGLLRDTSCMLLACEIIILSEPTVDKN